MKRSVRGKHTVLYTNSIIHINSDVQQKELQFMWRRNAVAGPLPSLLCWGDGGAVGEYYCSPLDWSRVVSLGVKVSVSLCSLGKLSRTSPTDPFNSKSNSSKSGATNMLPLFHHLGTGPPSTPKILIKSIFLPVLSTKNSPFHLSGLKLSPIHLNLRSSMNALP